MTMAQGPLFLRDDPETYLGLEDTPTRPNNRRPQVATAEVLPPVLSIDEAAELLRVNRKTLYEAVRRGHIPGARRIGRIIRVDRETLLAWLRCQEPVIKSTAQGRAALPGGRNGSAAR
jgi:excisionase family DNA binding protein